MGSPSHANLTEDYSIVALVRGLNPAKSVLILAGTTTMGTQAAVEFVCQQEFARGIVAETPPFGKWRAEAIRSGAAGQGHQVPVGRAGRKALEIRLQLASRKALSDQP